MKINFKEILAKINPQGNKKVNTIIIWLVIGIIALIAGSSFFTPAEDLSDKKGGPSPPDNGFYSASDYEAKLENQLADIVSSIKGAGKARVMITLANTGEKIYARDTKKNEQINDEDKAEGDKKRSSSSDSQNEVILYKGSNSGETPLVAKEYLPDVLGVIVLAEGAEDSFIKNQIYEAAKAVLNVPPHRIQVFVSK